MEVGDLVDLPNHKDLKALLKVCREFGVDNVEVGALKIKFGDMPGKQSVTEEQGVIAGTPSAEEMAYWSAAPDPLAQMIEAAQ